MSLSLGLDHLEIAPDKPAQKSEDCLDSGVVRFEVDNVSALNNHGRYSHEIEVGGVPWKLHVKRGNINKDDFLSSYLYVWVNKSRMWSIDVNSSFTLVNSDSIKNVRRSLETATYKYKDNNWGTDRLLAWNDLMDEEKGFINDNKITVEVRFEIVNFEGVRFRKFSFTDGRDDAHDLVLVMDGKMVHVSKQILAIHSPVFNAMFYGNFDEKDKKEIELKDIDRGEFIEMLHLIYPSYKKITDDNSEYILRLADRFQIQSVIDQVEQFLIKLSSMSVPSKLKLSNTYRLSKLQEHCLQLFGRYKEHMNQEDIDSFIVDNIVKIETTTQFDFTDANEPLHDIALVFDKGEKIYACKKYLSVHLTKLRELDAMRTEGAKEMRIGKIDREEFLEMLRVIYSTGQKITDENVKFLAKLGARFKVKYLLDLIETHLISSSNLGLATKLLLSDKYKLINLQVHCFDAIVGWDDFDDIKESDEYERLSDATKVGLVEETFRLPR